MLKSKSGVGMCKTISDAEKLCAIVKSILCPPESSKPHLKIKISFDEITGYAPLHHLSSKKECRLGGKDVAEYLKTQLFDDLRLFYEGQNVDLDVKCKIEFGAWSWSTI